MEVICKMSALELLNLLRPWDYPENFGIILKLIEKKPVFSDHKGPKGGPYENELLTIFKWKYEFPKELGLEKQKKKMGSFARL